MRVEAPPGMATRLAAHLLFLCLACWLAGCDALRPTSPPAPAANPFASPGGEAGPPQESLLIHLQMMGIEVPAGAASDSEDIWSYVEEEASGARGAALGRNGFRVGLVRRENWNALERVLKQVAGRQASAFTMSVLPNNPQPITLKPAQPPQTLFIFRGDRSLCGEDYPPCDNILTIVCTLNEDEPNRLLVLGQPQLRSTGQKLELVEERGQYVWMARSKVYELPDLTFRLSVPSQDIIVVGPGAGARRSSSVAHHFLIKERDGLPFETVLLLVPSVVRVAARTVPVSAASGPPAAGGS